jgi:glutathione peroxidase
MQFDLPFERFIFRSTHARGYAMRLFAILIAALLPVPALAGFSFPSIDGGTIEMDAYLGKPVLVVNTASLCGFAPQFDDLQALHDTYGPRGLVVLAVPSDDFRQELSDAAAVKDYCEANFDLTIPMTDITHVKGDAAHPFYAWLAAEHDFVPGWNFNKVLIGPAGEVVATWGSVMRPNASPVLRRIEALLP